MSFPRYPKYKASGVEWLGDVPEHWELHATKRLFRLIVEPAPDDNDLELLSIYTEIGVRPRRELEAKGNKATTTDGYWKVKKGDLIVNKLLAWMGAIGVSNYDGVTSPAYDILRQTRPLDPRFYDFLFRCGICFTEFRKHSRGIMDMRLRLYFEDFGQLLMPFPPEKEQRAIAGFLDRETAKIDGLVAEQRRLIELLKEKRQAVISHAVTKGLNPRAPMKPSGIEWLGDVPEHWRFGAIKHFVLPKNGAIKTGPFGSHLTSADMQLGSIKVYNQRSVIDGDFDAGENFISEEKFAELANFETFPGDLLVTTRGTIGRAAVLPENAERGILHPCLLRLQPDNSQIDTQFLKALIQDSDLMKTQLSYLSNATTIEVIYSNTIASVIVPVPPIGEQEAILQFLDRENAKLDELTAEAQRAIDLLQERRTALISAAVTGKIDVRGLAEIPFDPPKLRG